MTSLSTGQMAVQDVMYFFQHLFCRYGVPSGTIVKVSCLSSSPEAADAIDEAPGKTASQVDFSSLVTSAFTLQCKDTVNCG